MKSAPRFTLQTQDLDVSGRVCLSISKNEMPMKSAFEKKAKTPWGWNQVWLSMSMESSKTIPTNHKRMQLSPMQQFLWPLMDTGEDVSADHRKTRKSSSELLILKKAFYRQRIPIQVISQSKLKTSYLNWKTKEEWITNESTTRIPTIFHSLVRNHYFPWRMLLMHLLQGLE